MVVRPLAFLASLALVGCITPPETGTPSGDGNKAGAVAAAPGPDAAAGPQPGAAQPPSDQPAGDAAGGTPVPGPGDGPVQMPAFKVNPGEGIALTGTITWTGTVGKLRVDVLTKKEDGSPDILHAATLDAGGAFRIEAPRNTGKVTVMAFVDKDGNGPGPNEPADSRDVEIGGSDVTGLSFDLDRLAAAIGGDFAKPAPAAAAPGASAATPGASAATPAPTGAPAASQAAPTAAPSAAAPPAKAEAPKVEAAKPAAKVPPKAAPRAKKKDGAAP